MTDWAVVLPALDEEEAVEGVVRGFLAEGPERVVVVDNASRDRTAARAREAGALVVEEHARGYGRAVLRGLAELRAAPPRFVVVADCDGTIHPREVHRLLDPLRGGRADLALGRRIPEPGAMPAHQGWGNAGACLALRAIAGARVRDVSPYRAMTWTFVEMARLRETTYGLPMETIARAARMRARILERDVTYRRRGGGRSKVGGRLGPSLKAAWSMARVAARVRREPA